MTFVFQNAPDIPALKLGELRLSTESREHTTSKFDISLFIRETSKGIQGTVEYATDLYMSETIDRMIIHYINLLDSIAAKANEQVGRLRMLNIAEEETLLIDFNSNKAEYTRRIRV